MFALRGATAPLGQAQRQRRSPALPVLAVCTLCALLILLSGCGTPATSNRNNALTSSATQVGTSFSASVRQVQARVVPAPSITTAVYTVQRRLYTFSPTNVGLMQPAVDAQDNVWIGEMHSNLFGRLDTHTGVVTTWTPPGGQYGIMTTTIDAQGNIWFAEQIANYIGRFDPRKQTFRIYSLGTWQGNPLGPQDLHFDGKGLLWFTATVAGVIGRLDPRTGAIRIWPVPSPNPAIPSSPYCLTIASDGRVWFGDLAGGAIGILDPQTGQITLYELPNPQVQVFSMATDAAGRLWFTEVLPGKLGMFNLATGTLTELPVPALSGEPPALYGLAIDHKENIWFVDVGANTLVRYAPGKQTLTFLQLSLPGTVPSSLTLDPAGNIWFTAGGSPTNYVVEVLARS
jgi:virginiamycin B lyase